MIGWACFAEGTVAREGSFQSDEGTRTEAGVGANLADIDWVICRNRQLGFFFQKL